MEKNTPSTGHPKGLYLLFVTEMWERFSYYGMRALFMLFMVQALLLTEAEAGNIYGSYTGLVYLTPLIGGYVSDRYWGQRRSVLVGGILMGLGQLLMFFSASFYDASAIHIHFPLWGNHVIDFPLLPQIFLMWGALTLIIIGNGFFKPNISTVVGALYEPTDKRKDSAFTIFYMGINAGAFIAPIVCGLVGNTGNPADFKWGFLCAAIGMGIGILVFEFFKNKYIVTPEGMPIGMPPAYYAKHAPTAEVTQTVEEPAPAVPSNALTRGIISAICFIGLFAGFHWGGGQDLIGAAIYAICIVVPVFIITDNSLTSIERKRIGVIYIIAFFVIFFWAAFEQAGASLTLYADKQVDRNIFGWEMPAAFFQSFNPVFIITLAPIVAFIWNKLGAKGMEPASPTKQAMGLLLLSLGYLVIAFGVQGLDASPGMKSSIVWLTSMYLIHTIGELCLSPIGLSMVNKLAPARLASLLMGVWFLSTATANKFAGTLSALYPYKDGQLTPTSFMGYEVASLFDFFMLFVYMSAVAAVVLFVLSKQLQKMMGGIR